MTTEDSTGRFVEEDHPSDALVHVYAVSREALFRAAARACFSLMTDVARVRAAHTRELVCEGRDREDLLVIWLNELIGLSGAERVFFSRFDVVELSETRLVARVGGEAIDPSRHSLKKEVKAATYHRLSVHEVSPGRWEATVLFDL